MRQNILETIVGFIVIIVASMFLLFAYKIGNRSHFEDTYTIEAKFENAEGINNGSDVMLAGIPIGIVEKTVLDKNNYMAVVTLKINKKIKLPKDSQAAVNTSGFIGGKYIAINPGSADEDLEDKDQIKYTQSSINIEALIGKLMYSLTNK